MAEFYVYSLADLGVDASFLLSGGVAFVAAGATPDLVQVSDGIDDPNLDTFGTDPDQVLAADLLVDGSLWGPPAIPLA